MLPNLKLKLSSELVSKLCLVQYIFRKNGIPDDVYSYIMKFLFDYDMNDVCIWTNGKFESIIEYDYDFDMCLKKEWNVFGDNFIKFIKEYMVKKHIYLKYCRTITITDDRVIFHICNEFLIHTLITITNYDVKAYLCHVDWNGKYDDIYIDENKIFKYEVNRILDSYGGHIYNHNFNVVSDGITKDHLKRLQQFKDTL